jgi:hypothetical protein
MFQNVSVELTVGFHSALYLVIVDNICVCMSVLHVYELIATLVLIPRPGSYTASAP